MAKNDPNHANYFLSLENPVHKQYLALRMFFVEGCSAEEVAKHYGYLLNICKRQIDRRTQKGASL